MLKKNLLRELLELDILLRIKDPHVIKNITEQFLFPTDNKRQDFPQLIGIGGGPGAGKNFLYEQMKKENKLPIDAVVHDPDLIMQAIPQYQKEMKKDPISAFKKWELPARQLANEILLTALNNNHNIIYIRTFALADSLNFVRAAKVTGYRFDAHILTCDINIALNRAKEREVEENRHIPEETIIQRHQKVLELLPDIVNIADNYIIYENNQYIKPISKATLLR